MTNIIYLQSTVRKRFNIYTSAPLDLVYTIDDKLPDPYTHKLNLTSGDHAKLYIETIKVLDNKEKYDLTCSKLNNFFQ